MNLSVVLDGAGKVAACVGVILGMSYVSGMFKMVGFYGEFHADWLFEMMDVQAIINDGLPLTSLFFIVFCTYLFGSAKIMDEHRGWFLLAVVLSSSLVALCIPRFIDLTMSYHMLAGVLVGVAGAALAAWIAQGHIYVSRSVTDLYHMIMALALVLGLSPYLVGQARAYDIQAAREETTEIVDSKNRVIGVLVRVVAGKYLVLDCNVEGQLSFYEISSSLKLRRSSGKCRAVF